MTAAVESDDETDTRYSLYTTTYAWAVSEGMEQLLTLSVLALDP